MLLEQVSESPTKTSLHSKGLVYLSGQGSLQAQVDQGFSSVSRGVFSDCLIRWPPTGPGSVSPPPTALHQLSNS